MQWKIMNITIGFVWRRNAVAGVATVTQFPRSSGAQEVGAPLIIRYCRARFAKH
jgi:hypothetical protein